MIRYINEALPRDKTVLLRVDFNVPLSDNNTVRDDTRIQYALPSIKQLLANNNRLILISHLGKPKDRDPRFSLKPVTERLQQLLPPYTVTLVNNLEQLAASQFKEHEIKFLENIRFFPEEKENSPSFAKQLAEHADAYVNDAFSVCHRNDASVVGIPALLPSFGGLQLRKEITMLDKLIRSPEHPFVAILGGSKISTKLPLIKKLLTLCDTILIAGGMANTVFKGTGKEIGKSLLEESEITHASELMREAGGKIVLPVDAVVCPPDDFSNQVVKKIDAISPSDAVYDIGPATEQLFSEHIARAKTLLWNGPVGMFEEERFKHGTETIAAAVMKNAPAFAVLGGGDTLNAIKDIQDRASIDHISTGGGAMLTYIADGTLPGIEALSRSS